MFKLNNNWVNKNGSLSYKPFVTPSYISDIESVDIMCLYCGHIFRFKIRHYSGLDAFRDCMKCKTRHTVFVNDGCIMIDAYKWPQHHLPKRYKISFVEW